MNLEFNITETINHHLGIISEIRYDIEQITFETVSFGFANKKERRSRIYNIKITRNQYYQLMRQVPNALSFDNFIVVFRPFVMGYYQDYELQQAFRVLDKDRSGSIQINELAHFLPVINHHATIDNLKKSIRVFDIDNSGSLNYDEFRTIILKGIGREIIFMHI